MTTALLITAAWAFGYFGVSAIALWASGDAKARRKRIEAKQ